MSLGIPERGMESVPGVKPPPLTDPAAVNRLLSPTKGGVSVLDKAQLGEALEVPKALLGGHPDALDVIVEAARLVVDGREVWWCENHETGPCAPHESEIAHCFIGHAMNGGDTCRMVRMILIDGDTP